MSIVAAVYIGAALGFCAGFAVCALLTMSKRSDGGRS